MKKATLTSVIEASFSDSRRSFLQNWRYEAVAMLISLPIVLGLRQIAFVAYHVGDSPLATGLIVALVVLPALNVAQLVARARAVPLTARKDSNAVADAVGLSPESAFRSLYWTHRK